MYQLQATVESFWWYYLLSCGVMDPWTLAQATAPVVKDNSVSQQPVRLKVVSE